VVAVEGGRCAEGGEIGACAWLGVTLAPQFADGRDRSQEPVLLCGRAEGDQRRAEQFLTHVADARGRAAASVLLVEDDLPGERGLLAAVLRRPADAGPARRGQLPVPGQALLEVLVLSAWTALAAQAGELAGQVVLEPAPDATAELLVLGGQLHCFSRGLARCSAGPERSSAAPGQRRK
jgi:hypothetical protein